MPRDHGSLAKLHRSAAAVGLRARWRPGDATDRSYAMRGQARAPLQTQAYGLRCTVGPDSPGQRVRELLDAATRYPGDLPFSRCPDIVGTAPGRPRIAGVAVRSLSCGSA